MKKLFGSIMIMLMSAFAWAQPSISVLDSTHNFVTEKAGVHHKASANVVKALVKSWSRAKDIEFKITQTDSTNIAKTLMYTDLADTFTYTLVRALGGTGVATLTCTNGTPWTSGKTKVMFSQNQGTGKVYFSAAVTSTSVITLYSYLQTTDAVTDAGYGSAGTFVKISVFP